MSDRKRERHKVGKYLLKLVYWTIKIMKDTDYRIMRPFVFCKRVPGGQQKVNTKYFFKYISSESHFLCRQKVLLVDLQHALVGDHDDLAVLLLVLLPQVSRHRALTKHFQLTSECFVSTNMFTFPPLSQILQPIHQYFSYRFPA